MEIKKKIIQHLPDGLFVKLKKWGWYGDFEVWQEAKDKSGSWDADNILKRVASSLLKVKNGEAGYERDSVLFDKIEYNWELLAIMMCIAAQNEARLNLIDFGGSLGSTYYQNKKYLDSLISVSWNIVEQPNFVEVGKKLFQDEKLRFYHSIHECCSKPDQKIDVILFSSVLQYLDYPFDILKEAFGFGIKYMIVDRTGFTLNNKERITIQKVPSTIYDASYPCRFFCEKDFIAFFEENNYGLISDFEALDEANIPSKYKGFIFQLKTNNA